MRETHAGGPALDGEMMDPVELKIDLLRRLPKRVGGTRTHVLSLSRRTLYPLSYYYVNPSGSAVFARQGPYSPKGSNPQFLKGTINELLDRRGASTPRCIVAESGRPPTYR
jgi:hypothetical protein